MVLSAHNHGVTAVLNETDFIRLRATLAIDPTSLDEGLINLAMDQMSIAEFTADAARIRDQAKFNHSQVVADISASMRVTEPKISQTRIDSEVPLYDQVIESNQLFFDADQDYTLWRGLSDAIRTKGSSIRAIADLIASGYMTKTTIYNERKEQIHQVRQQRMQNNPINELR